MKSPRSILRALANLTLGTTLIFPSLLLTGSVNAATYSFTGAKTNVTLAPGTYFITAYGAQGGGHCCGRWLGS